MTPEAFVRTLDRLIEGCQIIGHDYRYLYVNDAVAGQGRRTREELLGRTMMEVYPGIDRTPFFEALRRVLNGGEPEHFDNEFEYPDGSRGWFELMLQSVPVGACILSIDITERLTMQRLASRSQRLESLGTLAGGVAHDLNNALAPLLLSIGLMRDEQQGDPELLDTIEQGAERAVKLVRQLLTFAKGADGQRLHVRPHLLVHEMERMVKSLFPKTITQRFRADESLPSLVGDETQLHQVLLNFCVNARDAMPDGGELTVEADVMDVDETYASSVLDGRPGRFVTFAVRDTGGGIPPEVLDRIFEPFFTTKGPDLGTGLGLSTTLGIVRGHGGFLHVYSEVGRGTTFRAFLPVASDEVPAAAARENGEFRGAGRTVLVVDDDARVRQAATTVLGQLGFRVLTAVDGADGLLQLAGHAGELHLVVLDVQMPRMGGEAFYVRMRELLPSVPVLIASGHLKASPGSEPARFADLPHLLKPFSQADFVRALRGVIGEAP
jgi:PAS domain S-box-containing protein